MIHHFINGSSCNSTEEQLSFGFMEHVAPTKLDTLAVTVYPNENALSGKSWLILFTVIYRTNPQSVVQATVEVQSLSTSNLEDVCQLHQQQLSSDPVSEVFLSDPSPRNGIPSYPVRRLDKAGGRAYVREQDDFIWYQQSLPFHSSLKNLFHRSHRPRNSTIFQTT